jgi:hypothetical protein
VIDKEELTKLIKEGWSQARMAEHFGCSEEKVKTWIAKHKLSDEWKAAVTVKTIRSDKRRSGSICTKHAEQLTVTADGRTKCRTCAVESVSTARRGLKADLVEMLGGECQRCGYNRCFQALQFDHRDPSDKEDSMARLISAVSTKRAVEEAKKCDLLCANCHAEKTYQYATEAQMEVAPV